MLNKVILIGYIGQDPEIKKMQSGKERATFSIATSERWKDKDTGEKKEKTEWHRVVVFNEHIVNIVKQYVKKGSKIWIEGQLTTRSWDDKGITRYSTEINIKNKGSIVLLDSMGSNRNEPPEDAYEEDY